jgi:hypothetical protein
LIGIHHIALKTTKGGQMYQNIFGQDPLRRRTDNTMAKRKRTNNDLQSESKKNRQHNGQKKKDKQRSTIRIEEEQTTQWPKEKGDVRRTTLNVSLEQLALSILTVNIG